MITEIVRQVSVYAVPLLIAVIAHEVAHGWVADKLGDPTARLLGRISFNPLVHIDPIGTVVLPLFLILVQSPFLFGWAKPVPIQFHNLRGGRRAVAWVALAGPLTNLMLASVSAMVYHGIVFGYQHGWLTGTAALRFSEPAFLMARFSVVFNLVLLVVNLFPLPPLDGGRILTGLLPPRPAYGLARLERYGMMVVILLLATGVWERILNPVLSLLLMVFLG